MRPKGLGRGLDALLDTEDSSSTPSTESLARLPIDKLQRGKYQPRTIMDQAALEDLAESIRKQGLMQPLLVRPLAGTSADRRYEIIAGERRWRAARLAGLAEVPVVIREVSDQAALAMALIENIQREDLNPIEQAQGLQRLAEEFRLTHQEIADAVGRSRAAITNTLRLLNLAKPVQQLVLDGKLDMGHARALLALDPHRQETLARKVAEQQLSVRDTEKWVNAALHPETKISRGRTRTSDRDVQRLEEQLSERLGTTVEIRSGRKGSGKLIVRYVDNRHLQSLIERLR
jgi:ParB family transcriptional regulator, chromosome partitioning protein